VLDSCNLLSVIWFLFDKFWISFNHLYVFLLETNHDMFKWKR